MADRAAPAASALSARLVAEIARHGPIPVARYMALALGDAAHGYYRRRDPLGPAGDFVSAPEIGQVFGEILGLWLGQAWVDLGRPQPFRLVELGPGHGTLMVDLLRAAARVPGFGAGARVHLVETSEPLRQVQRDRLGAVDASWHATFDDVPAGPMLLVANELFDALPVHQLVRRHGVWHERRVGIDGRGGLTFVVDDAPSPLAEMLPDWGDATIPDGTVTEVAPARTGLAAAIARRVVAASGVALIIDYGAWAGGPTGDTLQAVRGHAPWDPLVAPGEADLSTQVEFRALALAAAGVGAAVYGPIPQGPFLRAFGIDLRTARLLRRAGPGQREALRRALFRLTDASAMGELFKVLVLAGSAAPPPPGFHAPTLTPDPSPNGHGSGR